MTPVEFRYTRPAVGFACSGVGLLALGAGSLGFVGGFLNAGPAIPLALAAAGGLGLVLGVVLTRIPRAVIDPEQRRVRVRSELQLPFVAISLPWGRWHEFPFDEVDHLLFDQHLVIASARSSGLSDRVPWRECQTQLHLRDGDVVVLHEGVLRLLCRRRAARAAECIGVQLRFAVKDVAFARPVGGDVPAETTPGSLPLQEQAPAMQEHVPPQQAQAPLPLPLQEQAPPPQAQAPPPLQEQAPPFEAQAPPPSPPRETIPPKEEDVLAALPDLARECFKNAGETEWRVYGITSGKSGVEVEIAPNPVTAVGYARVRLRVVQLGDGKLVVQSAFVAEVRGGSWELLFEQA